MDHEHQKLESRELPGFFHFEPAWADFKALCPLWVGSRLRESTVIYRLPTFVLPTLQLTLGLSEDDVSAEMRFDELCLRMCAVAICNDRPIPYRWLLPAPAPFPRKRIEAMLNLGWTEAQIRKVPQMLQIANDISERVESIAGRRICNPEFLAERDRLRVEWAALPENQRPQFPLPRTPRLSQLVGWLQATEAPQALGAFLRTFDGFCERWHLLGMATWDLPDPMGPMWPEMTAKPQSGADDALVLRSPYDFPILDSDRVGLIGANNTNNLQKTAALRISGAGKLTLVYSRSITGSVFSRRDMVITNGLAIASIFLNRPWVNSSIATPSASKSTARTCGR